MGIPLSLHLANTWVIGLFGFFYLIIPDLLRKRRKIQDTYIPVTKEIRGLYILRDFAMGAVLIFKIRGVLFCILILFLIYSMYRIFMTGEGKLINDRTDLTEKEKTQVMINDHIAQFFVVGIAIVLVSITLIFALWRGHWF